MIRDRLPLRLPPADAVRAALDRRFGIDARALAAFRIALGLTLLFDALHRSRNLVAFYTDRGVLPRDLHATRSWTADYSLHMLSGEPWAQALLFACTAVLAVAVIVGYRSRFALLLSLVLVVSVQFRNPLVLNGADRLFREMLVLALFLPLGSRWGIDACGRGRESGDTASRDEHSGPDGTDGLVPDTLIATPATAAALVYAVTLFANNASLKHEGDTWMTGEALLYALRQDHMTILVGNHLANYPPLLEVGGYVWFWLLTASPLLLVVAGWARLLYAGVFLATVAGMSVSVAVGLFPALLATLLLSFLPTPVWDGLERGGGAVLERLGVRDGLRRAVRRIDAPPRLRSRLPDSARRTWAELRSVVLGAVLIFVVLWSIGMLGYVDTFEPVDSLDPRDHQWGMFAPDPSTSYGWYTVAAETGEGRKDVLQDAELQSGTPPDASETLPDFRWRRYMNSLSESDERADRFAEYMCSRADAQFDADVERIDVTYTHHPIELEGEASTSEYDIAEASCT
ncbi:hypothetical protein SAMN05444422_101203 [Halobiforma haloterrestris]|uniref:HTTM-like domain-containing protein n=1 Tax=Natronobacterium haloterrestre TaxID=148448 RepID=A0A1I1D238_NATHA|nr:hypothetical protein [Halobiforma haloterrestris]SFB68981.1 hypothetical protein SAMN05444422_101203 [Halobiforma haloterrestris]